MTLFRPAYLTKKLYPLPIKGALKASYGRSSPASFYRTTKNNYLAPCDCSKCGGARAAPAGVPLGEYDAAEGWRIIEGMRGGCYCDLSLVVCIVARYPCWTRGTE